LIFQKIISDLRTSNLKSVNHKLNRTVQNALFNLLTSDRESSNGLWAVKITRELWKRQIWTDSKAVAIMKEAALAENAKVIAGGVRFFLGGDKEREDAAEDESDGPEDVDMGKLRHQMGINKKTKKKERDLKKAVSSIKKKERKSHQPHPLNFSALHLLHDPQGFAESLFSKHLQNPKSKLQFEHKLLVLQLVSRLIGLHKLTIISFFSYTLRYLTPRQQSVTTFLASLAQATHSLVPPDVLEPLILKIATEFVSEGSASEVASAGLNAIREICVRQPLAMNETLLQDLVMYRKSKDKGVMMAAKGLLSLYREVGADLLKRADRGKDATIAMRSGARQETRFGEEAPGEIEGLELLVKWKEETSQRKVGETLSDQPGESTQAEGNDENDGWENWNVEEDSSEDSDGWIDVHSDGDDIEISDSDEDKPPTKKQRTEIIEEDKENQTATEISTESTATQQTEPRNLATTTILTPADFAKLQELRRKSGIEKKMQPNKRLQAHIDRHLDDPLTATEIEGAASLSIKKTKEEKIAAAKGDKDEKHLSTTAKRKEKKRQLGKSSTNKEKERQKNFLMTLGKAKRKGKRSLVETRRALMGHIDRQKKGGRRGNR
jgi:protein SDA1